MKDISMIVAAGPQVQPARIQSRRAQFPLEQQPGSLFLGWGPKI